MLKKHTLVKLVAGAGVAVLIAMLATAGASAATAGTTLSVTASVTKVCTVSTTAVGFGPYNPNSGTDLDAQGHVLLTCTKGAATTIDLDLGANASGSTRQMKASGSADVIAYELYSNAGRTTVWGSGFNPGDAPSKAQRDIVVYGRITAGQDVPADSYSDTVNVTVNY